MNGIIKLCIALGITIGLTGCVVTGGIEYTDPHSGATARIGFGSGGKTLKPLKGLAK